MPSRNDVRGSHPRIRFAFDESPKYEPMSIASRSGGHGVLDPARAGGAHDRVGDGPQRQVLVVADVEDLAGRVGRERGEQQALDDVVDVEAVALLLAVAEHGDRVVGERTPDEDREEALEVVAQALARPEHVGEPHRARAAARRRRGTGGAAARSRTW